jgi:hypothetical protein
LEVNNLYRSIFLTSAHQSGVSRIPAFPTVNSPHRETNLSAFSFFSTPIHDFPHTVLAVLRPTQIFLAAHHEIGVSRPSIFPTTNSPELRSQNFPSIFVCPFLGLPGWGDAAGSRLPDTLN